MKKSVIIIVLAALLLMPLASAGFFEWITGKVTGDTNVTVEIVSNNAPTITTVNVTTGSTFPNAEGSAQLVININFSVNDIDGAGDIITSSALANLTKDAVQRKNQTCQVLSTDEGNKIVNFACNITIFYFDVSGDWTLQVSASDSFGAVAVDTSQTFTLGLLTSLSISPNKISWSGLTAGSFDKTAGPTILNNTGNFNFTLITLNATHLTKEGDVSNIIGIGNFTVNASDAALGACNSTNQILQDGINVPILLHGSNLDLLSGNYTGETGAEEVFYCLDVPSSISSGNYSTQDSPSRAW